MRRKERREKEKEAEGKEDNRYKKGSWKVEDLGWGERSGKLEEEVKRLVPKWFHK